MKLHWYELVYRGISRETTWRDSAAVEHEHVNFKGKNFGSVAYIDPLTEQQIRSYELNPIDPVRGMNDVELYCLNNK